MELEFRILGPLEVVDDSATPLELGAQKHRALLAMLLLHANEVVSRDRLIDALWEDDPPPTAQKALQVYISQLRKSLGRDRVETITPGYRLRVAESELDAERFERLLEAGKPEEALTLWRGQPLADVAYSRFAQAEIARLDELRLGAFEARIDNELAASRHTQLIGELEGLVRRNPLRERLRGQLMLALYRSGRQAEALEAYQDARRALTDELGIEPGRELRDLQQAILNQDSALNQEIADEITAEPSRGIFVGRTRELSELLAGLESALAGSGRLFLVRGEPGIGKSRLADELVAQARRRGAWVLIGRSWEAGGAPAYWPWVQALRTYIERNDPGTIRSLLGPGAPYLAQLLPELRGLFPELSEPSLESESARFRLFEAATSFLKRATAERAIVLVLDDLHAADEPSLLLLQFVARELADKRILIIGAYRDVDPSLSESLTAALVELGREPSTRTIALSGLEETEVELFIELTTNVAAVELAAAVHSETEGNPLFVGEIVRLLAAEGRLADADAALSIPQSVRDVIGRRLRHLSDEAYHVLVLASVLGREFALDALSGVAGVSEDELLDTLDEAMAARVVSDVPGSRSRLRFAHVLIRDTLYDGLTTARRVRLHRAAVEALEALYGAEAGPHLAELSHHAIAGSDFDRGLRYARLAGDRALGLLAYEEAARLYSTALDALALAAPDDERLRCELLLSLGEAQSRAGNTAEAREVFLEAADIARRLDLSTELASAAAGYGGRIVFGRAGADTRLVPLLEEGLASLGQDEVELRARLLARLAGALRDEHSRERRDALSRDAVELARTAGESSGLAYALDGRAAAITAPDTVDECLEIATELCAVASEIGDAERVVYGLIHRVIAQLTIGDVTGGVADLEEATGIATELRQPTLGWQVVGAQAMLALASGRLDEADDLSVEALRLGEKAHDWLAVPVFALQRYALAEFRGDPVDSFESTISDLSVQYPRRPLFRAAVAHVQLRRGHVADAQRTVDELAPGDFGLLPLDMEYLYATSVLAEVAAGLGDPEAASALYRALTPWKHLSVVDMGEGMRGSVARYLGLLASTLERFDEAEQHFEAALESNERMGLWPWCAHTQEDYGRMLIENGDAARGEELVDRAVATYRELGMDGPVRRMTSPATG